MELIRAREFQPFAILEIVNTRAFFVDAVVDAVVIFDARRLGRRRCAASASQIMVPDELSVHNLQNAIVPFLGCRDGFIHRRKLSGALRQSTPVHENGRSVSLEAKDCPIKLATACEMPLQDVVAF